MGLLGVIGWSLSYKVVLTYKTEYIVGGEWYDDLNFEVVGIKETWDVLWIALQRKS